MKRFISLITLMAFACMCMATAALAASNGGTAFALYSGASAAVKNSAAINVRGFKVKSATVSGATLASNAGAIVYKNMSGTFLVQCGPTSSGPWITCAQDQSSAGADVSTTVNHQLTWADAVAYIRLQWTSSTTGQKIKAWLNWVE